MTDRESTSQSQQPVLSPTNSNNNNKISPANTSNKQARAPPRNTGHPESKPDIEPYPLDDEDEDDDSNNSNSNSSNAQHLNDRAAVRASGTGAVKSQNGLTASSSASSSHASASLLPSSSYVDPLLTDLYQLTMCYAYWKNDKHNDEAVFDLFYRENPFGGEFTIFAGLEEVLRFVHSWHISTETVAVLRARYPGWDAAFWDWLSTINTSALRIYAIEEGTVCIGRIPLIRVEGPLALCQLMETTFLVLVNYPTLVTTNAARHRLAVGPHKTLLEFGLRRAQGPDGAVSASRYTYIGGFDGTSNVKASLLFGIPCQGTHAHSFVSSFISFSDIKRRTLAYNTDAATTDDKNNDKNSSSEADFVGCVQTWRTRVGKLNTNQSELAAFIAYAQAYPRAFLALVDTYDVLESGLYNFIIVALALHEFGYTARGIRLDSGDLAYLSKECRKLFVSMGEKYSIAAFPTLTIVASNDLSENVLYSLREQGHEIDCFAIGTHLVTCRTQPALGCVYKLVSINDQPRIKVSHDAAKITIPGKKEAYRLYGSGGEPVLDLMIASGTQPPIPHRRILCRHPFDANKRVYVTPSKVVALHSCVWDGALTRPFPSLSELKHKVQQQLASFRSDHLRRLNPTPYKLSVTSDLYTFMHDLWLMETPIAEIK